MTRTLGWIAAIGLGVGVASLSLALAIGGPELRHLLARGPLGLAACADAMRAGASERRLPWTGGDTIELSLPVSLRLVPGAGGEVVIRGPSDAISHLDLRGSHLSLDCRLATSRTIEIELPARALRNLRIAGFARASVENLSQPEMRVSISGSGNLRLQGAVDRLAATISGSGDVRLADLDLKRLTVKISGSGTVEGAPKDEADLTISGSGTVRLLSRPESLRTKISGSGRISQPPVEAAGSR
jgi:hypothetical protein